MYTQVNTKLKEKIDKMRAELDERIEAYVEGYRAAEADYTSEENLRNNMNSIGYRQLTEFREQQTHILEYCRPHTDQMWAAKIVSIILGCDFRDAKQKVEEYFENTTNTDS